MTWRDTDRHSEQTFGPVFIPAGTLPAPDTWLPRYPDFARAAVISAALIASSGVAVSSPYPVDARGQVFCHTQEDGTFSEWTSVTADADLTVDAAAALANTHYGIQVVVDDTTTLQATQEFDRVNARDTGGWSLRYHASLENLTINVGNTVVPIRLQDGSALFRFQSLISNNGGTIQVRGQIHNDAGANQNGTLITLDSPTTEHVFAFIATWASSATASDGTLEFFIDGVSQELLTGLDIYDRNGPDILRAGLSGADGVTAGTFKIDEVCFRDDTQLIEDAYLPDWRGVYDDVLPHWTPIHRAEYHRAFFLDPNKPPYAPADLAWAPTLSYRFLQPGLPALGSIEGRLQAPIPVAEHPQSLKGGHKHKPGKAYGPGQEGYAQALAASSGSFDPGIFPPLLPGSVASQVAHYPDWIPAPPRLLTAAQTAFFQSLEPIAALYDESEFGWAPAFDAQVHRRPEDRYQHPSFFGPGIEGVADVAAEELGWLAVYPEMAPGRRPIDYLGRLVTPELPIDPPPQLINCARDFLAADTTTSATAEAVDGLSTTIDIVRSAEIVAFLSLESSVDTSNRAGNWRLVIDSETGPTITREHSNSSDTGSVGVLFRSGVLPAGTYTVSVEHWITGGAGTLTTAQATLAVMAMEDQGGNPFINAYDTVASDTTLSATLEDIDGLTQDLSLDGTNFVLGALMASVSNSGANNLSTLAIDIAGEDGTINRLVSGAGDIGAAGVVNRSTARLTGTQTVKGQHATDGGTLTTAPSLLFGLELGTSPAEIPSSHVRVTAGSTTSASLVDIPGLNTDVILSQTSNILALLTLDATKSSGGDANFAIQINGVDQEAITRTFGGANDDGAVVVVALTAAPLAPGTYTVTARWSTTGGTLSIFNEANLTVLACEHSLRVDVPELSWAPTYPDFARTQQPAAEFPAFVFVGEPADVPPAAERLAWLAVYPDFARGLTLDTANQPTGAYAPDVDEIDAVALYPTWESTAPNQLPAWTTTHGAQLQQPFFFDPEPRPDAYDPQELGWAPSYADFARAETLPTAAQTTGAFLPDLDDIAAGLLFPTWTPTYPDELLPAVRVPAFPALAYVPDLADFAAEAAFPTWLPTYPAFARTTPPTTEFPAFVFVGEPSDTPAAAERFAWEPVLPDFARVSTLSVAAQPFLFYQEDVDELDAEALYPTWSPVYPATAPGTSLLTAQHPTFVFYPEPQVDVPTIPYSVYPDALEPLARTAWYPSIFSQIDVADIAAETPYPTWLPVAPSFARAAHVHVSQIPSVFYDSTATLPAAAAPELSWAPTLSSRFRQPGLPSLGSYVASLQAPLRRWPDAVYPDAIEPTRGLHASQQRPFFFDTEPIPNPVPDVVSSSYPDQVEPPRGLPTALRPSFFAPAFWPPNTDVPKLAWTPVYPGRIDPPQGLTPSLHPSFFQPAAWAPNISGPAIGWLPVYPTTLPQWDATTHASRIRSVFFDPADLKIDVDQLAWHPVYPDALPQWALSVHTSRIPSYAEPGFWPPNTTIPDLSWSPVYPDFARVAELHASQIPSVFPPAFWPPNTGVPELAWAPVYPSRIAPTQGLEAQHQRATFFDPDPQVTPIDEAWWRPVYPSWLAPPTGLAPYLAPSYAEPAFWPPNTPVPALSWTPDYPAQLAPPAGLPAYQQQTVAFNPAPQVDPVDELAWRPVYPDIVRGLSVHASQQDAFVLYEDPLPDEPVLSWAPVYPDSAPGRPPLTPTVITPVYLGEPVIPQAVLSWAPVYPDFARRQLSNAAFQSFWFQPGPEVYPNDGIGCILVTTEGLAQPLMVSELVGAPDLDTETLTQPLMVDEQVC